MIFGSCPDTLPGEHADDLPGDPFIMIPPFCMKI
jgi:hypothetical protein